MKALHRHGLRSFFPGLTALFALSGLAIAPATTLAEETGAGCRAQYFCCPDDYRPKPWPCLPPPVTCGHCDNYCGKPLPWLPCPACGCGPDMYCDKSFPCAPYYQPSRWLKCPLPATCDCKGITAGSRSPFPSSKP